MEHKKSRLDLDSSSSSMQDPNPRNMSPFFNTSLGGGGSGVGGPHRGRYTRSSMGGIPTTSSSAMSSASSSRFSPYSVSRDRPTQRRSIPVITAQRDDRPLNRSSLGGGGSLFAGGLGSASSTAQKIMDSLASMSTPVLNAGRVRIDSISKLNFIVFMLIGDFMWFYNSPRVFTFIRFRKFHSILIFFRTRETHRYGIVRIKLYRNILILQQQIQRTSKNLESLNASKNAVRISPWPGEINVVFKMFKHSTQNGWLWDEHW